MPKSRSDFLAVALFCGAVLLSAFAYGVAVGRFEIFPFAALSEGMGLAKELTGKVTGEKPWYYFPTSHSRALPTYLREAAYPGLNLVTGVGPEDRLAAYVLDMDGRTIHSWEVDWFEIWPDARHLSRNVRPKVRPGTHVHGAVVLDDGDLVYNYEFLGLVRLDLCGDVVWRLPYRTHHSIHKDDQGDLWVSAMRVRASEDARYPNHVPPFVEPFVLEVSQDGTIKSEISVLELLMDNGLSGLLYMSATRPEDTQVTKDTLHLNDVEPFSSSLQSGLFAPGDVMISLRNNQTVLVFNADTRKIKHAWVGAFVRQHDPDFLDGNTISVFDNNNNGAEGSSKHSQLLLLSAASNQRTVLYAGNDAAPFYTRIMGKHQWLPNGNVLISESMKGRAFEIDSQGRIVWEYINLVGDGYAGVMEEVQRLPERMNAVYSEANVSARCSGREADD